MNRSTYVITWHWSDMSGYGVVATRDTLVEAEGLVALLKAHSDAKQYLIHIAPTVPV